MAKKQLKIGKTELRILDILNEYNSLTIAELARVIGHTRSWIWKNIQKLENKNLVKINRIGGITTVSLTSESYKGLLRIGILRATEYPYILKFIKKIKNIFPNYKLYVYDEAFRLSMDLAIGKIHLAMAPVISILTVHRITGGKVKIIGGGSGGGSGIVYSKKPKDNHATTMASAMEMCAEIKKLPGKRMYMRSGDELLEAVERNKVGMSVVWQPYLEIARKKGFKIESCNLPFCCVLGAHISLHEKYEKIQKMFEKSMLEFKREGIDFNVYSSIIGFPEKLVQSTISSYKFFEKPPLKEIEKSIELIKNTVFPPNEWKHAVFY